MPSAIRAETIDGKWETLGLARFSDFQPSDINPDWNDAGPNNLSFNTVRPANILQSDLQPFTPVELVPRGAQNPSWAGYIEQSPPGQQTQVTCKGWQWYLDEVQAPMNWVHARLEDWEDARQNLYNAPSAMGYQGQIGNDNGSLQLTYPPGTYASGRGLTVMLDLGEGNQADQIVIEYETSANGWLFYCRAHHGGGWTPASATPSEYSDAFAAVPLDAAHAGPLVATHTPFVQTYRYFSLFLYTNTAGAQATDIWIRFKRVLVGRSAYIKSSPTFAQTDPTWSTLNADDVFKDVLGAPAGTPLWPNGMLPMLSDSTSRIASVSFNIPHFHFGEVATARTILSRANDYHGYRWGVDADRQLFFQPQPTTPALTVAIRDLPPGGFQDQSTNDGSEVYNHVRVIGKSGAGEPLIGQYHAADFLSKYTSAQNTLDYDPATAQSVTSGGGTFDSAITGVTADANVTISHVPGSGHNALGALRIQNATLPQTPANGARIPLSGTFKAGTSYRITWWVFSESATSVFAGSGEVGVVGTDVSPTLSSSITNGVWTQRQIIWTPTADRSTNVVLHVFNGNLNTAQSFSALIDDVSIEEGNWIQPGHVNPGAEGNTDTWFRGDGGAPARDTTFRVTGAGSDNLASIGLQTAASWIVWGYTNGFRAGASGIGGKFLAGVPYRLGLSVGWQVTHAATYGFIIRYKIDFGRLTGHFDHPGNDFSTFRDEYIQGALAAGTVTSTWVFNLAGGSGPGPADVAKRVTWVPSQDYFASQVQARVTVQMIGLAAHTLNKVNVDQLTLETGQPVTVLDRRARRKSFTLDVQAPTDMGSMRGLAQTWLLAHRSTPFKGTLQVPDDVVYTVNNTIVPRNQLGRYAGEMIRIVDAKDPDTGQVGRDAIITNVTGEDQVQLSFDNTPKGLDALFARMGVVQGQA